MQTRADTGFSDEQKRYLEGFTSGLQIGRTSRSFASSSGSAPAAEAEPAGPDAIHFKAQARTVREGGKLADQEKFKQDLHPFDSYIRLKEQATRNEAPKPPDNFRWRYHGLFYVAPTQSSYMCRLRIPNGILTHWQFAGVADIAEKFAGHYVHVTTRANLQLREIEPKNGPAVIESIQDIGLCSRGSGADNIRNVTGTPTAGVDPQELRDTRPDARAMHYHILNDRSLYGLPRKFNIAFDGAGRIAVLEDTNDIAFQAVEVLDGHGLESGVHYRLGLGGITGHRDLARDTGVVVKPEDAVMLADAILRVFIEHGDRTNRNKARLKYLLDKWGFEKFLKAVEEKFGRPLPRIPAEAVKPRMAFDRLAHIGVHPQKQSGLNWIGVTLKLGRLSLDQVRGLAMLAREFGDGDIRLTVWQNLLLSGVRDEHVETVIEQVKNLGLSTEASALRAGAVACTGATGCRFAAAHTKEDAEEIVSFCEARVPLDSPVNLHVTGCHHSCAQHYIGDIGLIGARVAVNDDGDTVPGYNVVIGGGYGPDGRIGGELLQNVKAQDAPQTVEQILKAYLAHRLSAEETFVAFAARTGTEGIKRMVDTEVVA